MNDCIILVDENDHEIGCTEKMDAHIRRLRHRAFSIFIFDWQTKKMFLQKRAKGKYHSGGLWTNACCSHPRKDETMEACLNVRLKEELGMHTEFHVENPGDKVFLMDGNNVIYECGHFSYVADYGDVSENEIDHVYLYSPYGGMLEVPEKGYNPEEIEELKWISMAELKRWMAERPEDFTAWFQPAFNLAYNVLYRQARSIDLFLRGSQS